jgi:hypothetical protein
MSHAQVIQHLGGRDFDHLVDQFFLRKYGLSKPAQYGMVCADVAAEVRALEGLGCTSFIHLNMGAPGWTELGEKKKVKVEMAMGYTGDQQIELLGPGENTDFYREKIPEDGALALHHVCCMEENLDEFKRILPAAGYPLYLEGGVNMGLFSTNFAYFDTRKKLGFWLEIAEYRVFGRHRPPTLNFVSRLAGWQRRFSRKRY